MASFFASSKIIVFITFTLHVLLGNSITASSVFVTVSLYGTIKLTVTLFMPLAIEKLSETLVSVRRIKVILQMFVFSLSWIEPRSASSGTIYFLHFYVVRLLRSGALSSAVLTSEM